MDPNINVIDKLEQNDNDHLIIYDTHVRNTLHNLLLCSLDPLLDIATDTQDEYARLGDVRLEPLRLEEGIFGHAIECPLQNLKTSTASAHNALVRIRIRDVLNQDSYIINDAKYYDIPLAQRIVNKDIGSMSVVEFTLRESSFFQWMQCHASAIGTTSVSQSKHCSSKTGLSTRYFYCQCHGEPQKRKNRRKGGVSGKPRQNQKPSIKCGCPSSIITHEQPRGVLERALTVTYNYQHNHPLASLENINTAQQSARVKATIKNLLEQGSSVTNVMRRLSLHYDRFIAIVRGNGTRLSRDDFVTYEDVYNIWYKMQVEKMRKNRDPVLSAVKWLQSIEANGGFTFYDRDDRSSGVYFGFATKWQLQQLYVHGHTLCFDGTHDVFGKKTLLFTLVVKNRDFGFGVPVAFLLTQSTNSDILVAWLKGLCTKMRKMFSTGGRKYDYTPNAVVTDQGNTEVLSVKRAFPMTPILYCAWHILRAWDLKIKTRMIGMGYLSIDQRKVVRENVRLQLRSILYEKDMSIADKLIARFRLQWKHQKFLLAYLNKGYFGRDPLQNDKGDSNEDISEGDNDIEDLECDAVDGLALDEFIRSTGTRHPTAQDVTEEQHRSIRQKRQNWMLCYRQELSYASIDTNNYIESWHNSLKQHFFRDKQQRQMDDVIYVLNDIAVPHYQQKCMRGMVNVGKMYPVQKREAQLLKRVKEHIAVNGPVGMRQTSATTIAVQSLTTPETEYRVEIDFSRSLAGHIINCSCPDFVRYEMSCKHIMLVQMEIPHMTYFKGDRYEIERDLDLMVLPFPVEAYDQEEQPTDTDVAPDPRYIIDRINELESLRDMAKPLPHAPELCSLLSQYLHIYEPSFPRKEGENSYNKRARQPY